MHTNGVQYYYFFNEMFAQYVKSNESRRNKKTKKIDYKEPLERGVFCLDKIFIDKRK